MALDALLPAICDELRAMARATETLGQYLCADPEIAMRCLPLLQQFDLLAQQQGEIAALLDRVGRGVRADEALSAVRLEALASRLGREG